MAIIDIIGELSDAQDLAQSTGNYASTDIIDFTQYQKSLGVADTLFLNITCNTAFTSATSAATLTIALCVDTVAPIDGSSTVIYQTPAIAVTSNLLDAYNGKEDGLILCMPLPDNFDSTGGTMTDGAIVGLLYTIAGETIDTGNIDAWIGPPMQSRYDTQVAASNV